MPTQGVCAVEIVLLRKHHSGPFFRSFSSRRPTMFLKRSKNCPRCAAFSRRIFLPRRPLGQRYGEFKNHLLVSSYLIAEDWPTWEMHPHGDETVCLLSGSVEFLLRTGDGESRVSLEYTGYICHRTCRYLAYSKSMHTGTNDVYYTRRGNRES